MDPGAGRSSDFLLKCPAPKGQDPVRLKHYALDKGLWADGLAQRVELEVGGGKMPSGRGWKQMRWAVHTGSGRERVRVSVGFPPVRGVQGHVNSSGRGWAEGPGIGQPRVGESVPMGLQDRTLLERVLDLRKEQFLVITFAAVMLLCGIKCVSKALQASAFQM